MDLPYIKLVCQLDGYGIFVGMTEAYLDDYGSYLIPAGCEDVEPPQIPENHVAQWQPETQTWLYLPDYRGLTVYHTETGEAQIIAEIGELPENTTTEPRPTTYHTWDSDKQAWKISKANEKLLQQQQLTMAQTEKLTELNRAAEAYIDGKAKLSEIPSFELQTWTIQSQEAHAWDSDKSAPTPTLDKIAEARGVPREMLLQKALEKAKAFETLTAIVVGKRQALETQIRAAATSEAVNQIVIDFGD